MVDRELRARDIHDPRVLRAMAALPRHRFVVPELWDRAYEDESLPIAGGQLLPDPRSIALMTQALGLRGGEHVLEIGTGSGYQAALLGLLAGSVVSLEIRPELVSAARDVLRELGLRNVEIVARDGSQGWPDAAPYHGILVGAAATHVPVALLDQLAEGGRLVIPLGDANAQLIARIVKRGVSIESETLAACKLAPLVEAHARPARLPWVQ